MGFWINTKYLSHSKILWSAASFAALEFLLGLQYPVQYCLSVTGSTFTIHEINIYLPLPHSLILQSWNTLNRLRFVSQFSIQLQPLPFYKCSLHWLYFQGQENNAMHRIQNCREREISRIFSCFWEETWETASYQKPPSKADSLLSGRRNSHIGQWHHMRHILVTKELILGMTVLKQSSLYYKNLFTNEFFIEDFPCKE